MMLAGIRRGPKPELLDWPCIDGTGSTVTARTGPNGSWSGTATWSTNHYSYGSSVSCDGTSGAPYVSSASTMSYGSATKATACYWVRYATGHLSGAGVSRTQSFSESTPAANLNGFWVDGDYQSFYVVVRGNTGSNQNCNYAYSGSLSSIAENVWYHFAATWDATSGTPTIQFYLNGTLITPDSFTSAGGATTGWRDDTYYMMANPSAAASRWWGEFTEYKLFNRVLTASEIVAVMNEFGNTRRPT